MKTIFLLRHAAAEKGNDEIDDSKRRLLKTGKQEARNMAKEFADKMPLPELIITSPAKRAVETAKIVAKEIGYKKSDIVAEPVLFENKQEAYLTILKGLDNQIETVMLVGHNPSFSAFAAALGKGFDADLPTCGLVGITLPTTTWKKITRGKGQVTYYDYPGFKEEKVHEYKEFRERLEGRLTTMIRSELAKVDAAIAEQIAKTITKSGHSVAKRFVRAMRDNDVSVPSAHRKSPPKPETNQSRHGRTTTAPHKKAVTSAT
jgi:phosphohistidine phosphatase